MKVNLTIWIPVWLDKIFVWPILLYRQWRFGCQFRKIFLTSDEYTIVDPEDYYRFGKFKWSIAGNGKKFYAARIKRKTEFGRIKSALLHREIMNAPANLLVDHKNGFSLDNRKSNLRLATHSQNMHNRCKVKSKTSSKFIGIYFDKRIRKWTAKIRYQKKRIYLGSFKSEIEAAKAYDTAAKKYHGEFANLNFPENTWSTCKNPCFSVSKP